MFLSPVVLLKRAKTPVAVFCIPSVLLKSALPPVAVLLLPVELKTRASKPMAVLTPPVVLMFERAVTDCHVEVTGGIAESASLPTAVFPAKSGGAIQFWSASAPTAVWKLPVLLEGSASNRLPCYWSPVVLLKSANGPVAVLLSPVVFKRRAQAPLAVLELAGGIGRATQSR